MDRIKLQAQTDEVGKAANALRETLLGEGTPFLAGVIRAAEESILTVSNILGDQAIPEADL